MDVWQIRIDPAIYHGDPCITPRRIRRAIVGNIAMATPGSTNVGSNGIARDIRQHLRMTMQLLSIA